MSDKLRTAIACQILFVGCTVAALLGQAVPLPIVTRTTSASEATLFIKPDVILMARIIQSCDTEMAEHVPGGRVEQLPVFRSYLGNLSAPVRINARAADGPDLSNLSFYFRPRSDSATLTLGHTYVLMLDAVKHFPSGPEYTVSHRQMGFEVVAGPDGYRVRPIVKGGELDKYDGRLLDDVIKEIQGKK